MENNTTPPVLHQKFRSETSKNDINNTSKITTQLHLRIELNPVM